MHRILAARDLHVEDGLLDVGGEEGQIRDLRDPGTRQPGSAGEIGVVADDAVADEALEVVTEDK